MIKRVSHLFKYWLEPPRGENCLITWTGIEWLGNWVWRSSGAQQLVAGRGGQSHKRHEASFIKVQWLRLHTSNAGDPDSVPGPDKLKILIKFKI